MKKLLILFIFLVMTNPAAHAQELSNESQEEQIFWTQEVDATEEWGQWLKEIYKPYSDELGMAILKIISSTIDIDPTGKSSAELLEEVNAAYNMSLKSMEIIKPPIELKIYHLKIIELYRLTINSDPKDASKNALIIKQLSIEADQAMTKAFQLHGMPENVIAHFLED